MKKAYQKPTLATQLFAANEYVAGCGATNNQYKFVCNANSDGWFTDGGSVYVDSNNNGQWDVPAFGAGDKRLGSYSPCQETHVTRDGDEFLDGFLVNLLAGKDQKVQKVKIWRGEDGHNIHCTKNLDIESWETAKS